MKKTFRAALLLMFILAVAPFAQNVCIELCTPCAGKKKDQTCKKIEERCQCAALLDSVSTAKSAREAEVTASIDKLSFELQLACENKICTRKVIFENGLFKEIQNEGQPFTDEEAQALYDAKVLQSQSSMTRIEPLPPLNEECTAFCEGCPVTDKMLKAKKPKFKDKFCKKIEESCKCIEYAINAKQLEEQAKADSIAELESKAQRIENVKLLAKQIQDQATEDSAQAFTVVFANKEMVALDIQKAEIAIKEKEQEPVATVEEKPVDSTQVPDLQESNDKLASETAISEQDQDKRVFHEVDPLSSSKNAKSSESRSTYFGLVLAFERPKSEDYYGLNLDEFHDAFGINLGFFFRKYFNRFISFNIGLNAVFHYGDYDIYYEYDHLYNDHDYWYIDYDSWEDLKPSTIMAEIPFGFRFGIPLGSLPISPFISTNFHIRKPIYQWIYSESDEHTHVYNDFTTASDWEFIHFLGIGLEISRHFSLELQYYSGNFRTYNCNEDAGAEQGYINSESWRIKLEVAF